MFETVLEIVSNGLPGIRDVLGPEVSIDNELQLNCKLVYACFKEAM